MSVQTSTETQPASTLTASARPALGSLTASAAPRLIRPEEVRRLARAPRLDAAIAKVNAWRD